MTSPIIVLVVEDEALVRMEIADELSARGFEVLEASNAREAMRFLDSNADIQLLFTDVDIPGRMDGLMLAATTRNRWPEIKIIVTSGCCHVDQHEMPPESRFLTKPHAPDSIAAAMLQMMA